MAFPSSGLFVPTIVGCLNGAIPLDLDALTNKVALYTDSVTGANLISDTAYGIGVWASNESTGASYTAGGLTLANATWSHTSGGIVVWDSTVDPAWYNVTVTAHGALYYAPYASNVAIVAQNFGADVSAVSGAFIIQLPNTGIFSLDLIP